MALANEGGASAVASGIRELTEAVSDSAFYSPDMAPTTLAQRKG